MLYPAELRAHLQIGLAGLEPAPSSMSKKRSTIEPQTISTIANPGSKKNGSAWLVATPANASDPEAPHRFTRMMGTAGVGPAASDFGGLRSIQLSYAPINEERQMHLHPDVMADRSREGRVRPRKEWPPSSH